MKKERVYYFDFIRIISCLAVVFIHISAGVWYDFPINTIDFKFASFCDVIARSSVPLFFMISGALFLSKKEIDIKKLYTKNILNILIIMVIWLPIHGILAYTYKYGNTIDSFSTLKTIVKDLFSYQYQFWFLIPLVSTYICMPLWKKIADDEKVLKYALILYAIFQILIPSSVPIIGRGVKYQLLNFFTPGMIMGYQGYFLLGYFLFSKNLSKTKINVSYILTIFSIIVATIGTIVISTNTGEKYDFFFGYTTITTFLAAIGIFNFFKYQVSKIKLNNKVANVIVKLSDCTMGVYIFHNIIKWIIEKHIDLYFTSSFITIPIFTILIFVLSIVVTLLVKKIPFLGKYIV